MFLLQLVVFQALLFIGLAFMLRKLIGKHASSATVHLQGLTQDYMKKQEDLKKRLEESERQHQALMNKAQEEADSVRAQARLEAEEGRRKAVEEGRQEAEKLVQQALKAKEAMQAEMDQLVDKQALERACQLILEVMPQQLHAEAQQRWLDDVLANGALPMEGIELPADVTEMRVSSAVQLTPAQKEKLGARLKAASGKTLPIKEQVDPKLIAGVVITLGHTVLDGSLAYKLRAAARKAEQAHG